MQIVELNINDLKPYDRNPRKNDDAVEYVANSIKEFGFKVPVVIDKDNIVVAGHTRLKAAKKLGITNIPCIIADDLNEQQIQAFRLADNKVGEVAEWDLSLLDIELGDITDIDMSDFGFNLDDDEKEHDEVEHKSLNERFGVPPFSILDTRQGYWQERKRAWKNLGLKSEVGRDDNLMGASDLPDYANNGLEGIAPQTSIFDPVLAEIMYKWFCIEGGRIYDCFAGGSVRGVVAAKLGYDYQGIDIRQEQVDANYENASDLEVEARWYCDDSSNADKYIDDESVDMIFTCPPYADLEVYSDNPNDISNMEYDDFKVAYREIIDVACKKLKQDRFCVFVVGDVRDKNGIYRNFVDYTKECVIANGLGFYNEIILVEQSGTGALRAPKLFSTSRKVVKTHQNVLVFYKGNPKHIKDNFTDIEIDAELLSKEVADEE